MVGSNFVHYMIWIIDERKGNADKTVADVDTKLMEHEKGSTNSSEQPI